MLRRAVTAAVLLSATLALGGCGSINTVLSTSMADLLPQWAGGLPAGAPPRPGDAGYNDYLRALYDKALVPPAEASASGVPAEFAQSPAPPATAAPAEVSQNSVRAKPLTKSVTEPVVTSTRPNTVVSWHSIY